MTHNRNRNHGPPNLLIHLTFAKASTEVKIVSTISTSKKTEVHNTHESHPEP
ncbi:hypothetical protein CBM2597_A110017 [Cupriavidus taiwanensis]|nr:hypothetical protein CBM2597_A110017 [Cupriavidus taiwanensis]